MRKWRNFICQSMSIKILISILLFTLFTSVIQNNLFVYAETTKDIQVRDEILSLALRNSDQLLNAVFDIDKKQLTDDEMIRVYIGLLDYYIGEGPGEALSEKITKLQDKILPYLVLKKNSQIECIKKYKILCCCENQAERNAKIVGMIKAIKQGRVLYAEFPDNLKEQHEKDLKIIHIFIQDYKIKVGKPPDTLDTLREYAWREYGYKLKIYSPWFGKPLKYLPQKDGKYVIEAGDDKP